MKQIACTDAGCPMHLECPRFRPPEGRGDWITAWTLRRGYEVQDGWCLASGRLEEEDETCPD